MTKSLKSLWGRLLFQDRGILPTKRLLIVYGMISLFLITLGATTNISWPFIFLINILVIGGSLFDLLFSPRKRELSFIRKMPCKMERGILYPITIEINNSSSRFCYFDIVDGLPQSLQRPFPVRGTAQENGKTVATYETKAFIRGNYEIKKLYVRYGSRFRLWQKQTTVNIEQSIKVIPDLTETKQYLSDVQKYLIYEGLTIRKFRSGTGEFSQIRSYVVGDDPRMINWRQTAKLQEIMTNDYEPEHGKYITLMIDCGRMMGAELKKGNRLEKVLEAALMVAAAALQKGDYVSLVAFSKDVKVFVPAAKGISHLQTILQAIYNLQVDAVESNYGHVFSYLEFHQKKRSLLLLFSDVRTFLYEESALIYLRRIRQRHLFLMIGIEDQSLLERLQEIPMDEQIAMRKSIAQQQMLFKRKEKVNWEKQGLMMIEAREEKLAATAVSLYVELLNRSLV